ncbi:MAG: GtrA family protein [Bowdeniella nasicola]|nr:GtrA family protein [Bowdeniella nasicola]
MTGSFARLRRIGNQLLRFGIVGVANTAIYYAVYRLFLVFAPYLLAHVVGWLIATLFSFWMNCIFVFKVRPTLRRLIRFPAAPLVNLAISSFGSVILISWLHMPAEWGTLIAGIIAIPLTFTIAKFVLTGRTDSVGVGRKDAQ